MLVVITYDVETTTLSGQKRLRAVAKKCEQYGVRVQNSVFECIVDQSQLRQFELELLEIIDKNNDSIRIYQIGNKYKNKIRHYGAKETISVENPLIF